MRPPKGNSFSRIDTFTSLCERRYFLDIVHPEEVESEALLRGSRVHNMFETAAKHWLDTEEWWAEWPPEHKEELKSYWTRTLPVLMKTTPVVGGVERWFSQVRDLPFRGKIDLISDDTPWYDEIDEEFKHWKDEPCVLDYKTVGNRQRIKTTWEAKHSLQLQIYCLATGLSRAGFIYILPKGRPILTIVNFEEKDLDLAYEWLVQTSKIVKEKWDQLTDVSDPKWERLFSLSAPDHPLCCKKWCRHWKLCLGKDNNEDV